jgi:hypothetical protein
VWNNFVLAAGSVRSARLFVAYFLGWVAAVVALSIWRFR